MGIISAGDEDTYVDRQLSLIHNAQDNLSRRRPELSNSETSSCTRN